MENLSDFHPASTKIPGHIGLIPDGGRRWAAREGISLAGSYSTTKLLLGRFCDFLFESGIHEISIYLSSIQNFRRQQSEIEAFNNVSKIAFANEIYHLAERRQVRIVVAGKREILTGDYLKTIESIESITSGFQKGTVNLCIAYNPVEELIESILKAENKSSILENLWVKTPVDLIIRSGGANLLSNFLPLQSGFARIYFLEKLFNDLTVHDIQIILDEFSKLDRKFGT